MVRYRALVPAAGSGARFGAEIPKQYLELAGRPVIHHALTALCACVWVETVLVVLSPEDAWWDEYDWSDLGDRLRVSRCGGATRAETVLNGLKALSGEMTGDDWVLVHDAARPCLSPDLLAALHAELADDPVGGILAVPVADTLKRADSGQRIAATESREGLWQAQTPQMFRYGLLRTALEKANGVTDEAGAVEAAGFRPRLVRSEAGNLKITYPADLRLAALILERK